jgi:acetyltransferase-like isoleucine patch superfamily enzyme
MCPSNCDLVRHGGNFRVEDGAILGRLPDRKMETTTLMIGDDAFIRSGSVIYACTSIGDGLETGHNVVIREQNDIGDEFSLWSGSVVDYGCRIGDRVKIHCSCYLAQYTVIEDDVFMGPGVTVTNDLHPGCDKSMECMKGPIIKAGAVIGGGVVLLPRITVGERALVGAGSVVTRDVKPRSVVVGNPATELCTIDELGCGTGLCARPYGMET